MLKQIRIEEQEITESLTPERAGEPYELTFPEPISEVPNLGFAYRIVGLALNLKHTLRLKAAQYEALPSSLDCYFQLLRNGEVIGVWPITFQMRLIPGSEGKEWVGETVVSVDLANPIDYTPGEFYSFTVTGIVPGIIAGPTVTRPLPVEVVE